MSHYRVLLNECLKRHIVSLGRKDKQRLREKFEFLEAGIWDAGLRVKKLKGPSGKVILEARLSKGDRILFTLGRYGSATAVYVWGLSGHDAVSRKARSILPENAPFLNFEPEHIQDLPDILMEEAPGEWYTEAPIEQRSPEDYGPQRWLVLDEREWERMLRATDPDGIELFLFLTSEQRRVLAAEPPVLLSGTAGSGKTTLSVYYLLRGSYRNKRRLFLTYHRHLSDFSRRIYEGLVAKTPVEEDNPAAPDFLIFRELLESLAAGSGIHYDPQKEVRLREFESIFGTHRLRRKYDAELVWEEIRSIIKGAKTPIRKERFKKLLRGAVEGALPGAGWRELKEHLLALRNYRFAERIERLITHKSAYSGFEAFIHGLDPQAGPLNREQAFVLGEIGKQVERHAGRFSGALLSYEEYLNLGRKRAPNFLYERKDIYEIACYYQQKLEERGLWDEIDLCRAAVGRLHGRKDTEFAYDLVVCDEVQDFADIQLVLIFSLVRSYHGIVLAGDPKQIINPSGFRWEEVKNKFYERGVEVPDVYNLNLNFRSVGYIVALANALLDLKQQLVGLSGSEIKEEWKFNGRPPFLLCNLAEGVLLENLARRGAGRMILVRDAAERERLKKHLATELVFTIHEAKGLEFDTVLLWKFSSEPQAAGLWRRIREGHYLERRHHPHVRHEINLLYVAITRARNSLFIYEGDEARLWDIPLFQGLLYRTGDRDMLAQIWQRVSTREEWEKQGDYFFEREYYEAAAECYKNADNRERFELAEAFVLEREGKYSAAAERFARHGLDLRAAECYERIGGYEQALPFWKRLKDRKRLRLCRVRLWEQEGAYEKAAEEWARMKQWDRALENWIQAGDNLAVGRLYRTRKEWKKAAQALVKAGALAEAAACYRKAGQLEQAAELFFRAGDYRKALPLFKRLKSHERMIKCAAELGDFHTAAQLCERRKDLDRAVGYFQAFAGQSPENERLLYEESLKHEGKRSRLKAAVRYQALGMEEKAAPIFFEKGFFQQAVVGFEKSEEHERVAHCWVALGDYYRGAVALEKAGSNHWRAEAELLSDYIEQDEEHGAARLMQLGKEARRAFKEGRYEQALPRYLAMHDTKGIYRCFQQLGWDEEALRFFLEIGQTEQAQTYLTARGKIEEKINVSEQFLVELVSNYERRGSRWVFGPQLSGFLAQLLLSQLKQGAGERVADLAERFLSSSYFFPDDEGFPESVLELIIQLGHINKALEVCIPLGYQKSKEVSPQIKAFVDRMKRHAEETDHPGWKACMQFIQRRGTRADLGSLEVTRFNYQLFAYNATHWPKAVSFLVDQDDIEEALQICRQHHDYRRAGRILEERGQWVMAARHYRDGQLYPDALRCFQAAGDRAGMARIHERMGELDTAISIWESMGRKRDLARVLKKKAKAGTMFRQ